MTIQSRKLGNISIIHIMAPIRPELEAALRSELLEIQTKVENEVSSFLGVRSLHYLMLDIIEPKDSKTKYFVFSTVFDGDIEDYARLTLEAFPKKIHAVWKTTVDYPGNGDYVAFLEHVAKHSHKPAVFYAANPELSAAEAKQNAHDVDMLREIIAGGLAHTTPTPPGPSNPAPSNNSNPPEREAGHE